MFTQTVSVFCRSPGVPSTVVSLDLLISFSRRSTQRRRHELLGVLITLNYQAHLSSDSSLFRLTEGKTLSKSIREGRERGSFCLIVD